MKKRWPWIAALLLVILSGSAWFADRKLKKHGHPGLRTFIAQWWNNYPKSFAIEPPVVSITVDDAGMEQLYGVVERARDLGVIEREGNEYVDGEFSVAMPGGGEGTGDFKGKLRIKGKMTDHVEGEKWSFRVVARKSGGFIGMKRFSLQHPGTRNYLCDWFFHRLMKGEGIIAPRYGFCKVKLNDEDLGVYAYEEHFGPELLENNDRVPGPIVRFDPGLFWLHRTQGIDGSAKVDDAYGAYQAAGLDAFGTDDIAKDPDQKRYFEQAIALMEGFRRGRLRAGQVFDVERTGKRLAMLDLVGGHHSMDWSDVKFWFDPMAQRLEPISYESFSAERINQLAGAWRVTGPFSPSDELHTALFKDPAIFSAYVRNLERFSGQEWLDSAFAALAGALDTASATLYGEFPYKELDRSIYYANQLAIRKLLNVPKGFHAYNNGTRGDTLTLALVPIESLPMQVDSVLLGDGRFAAPMEPVTLPCRRVGNPGSPVEVRFLASSDSAVKVFYHIPGASTGRELEVFPFKLASEADDAKFLAAMVPNPHEFPFLAVDDSARTITIKPGAWKVDRTVVLPSGYRCVATWPLELDLVNGAGIISHAALAWQGGKDQHLRIFSSDSSSSGVRVISVPSLSSIVHVDFSHLTRRKGKEGRNGDVAFHASPLQMSGCTFRGTARRLIGITMGKAGIAHCSFSGGSDQLEAVAAQVDVTNCLFGQAQDDAVTAEGGALTLKETALRDVAGIAVKGEKGARITADRLDVARCGVAFEGREGGKLTIANSTVADAGVAAEAKKYEMRYGPVRIELNKVVITSAGQRFKRGPESIINVDGRPAPVNDTGK
ncbi:MAG: CotH kinase family protein [Bacteroidetes bacterium]|nr:CotH kinase family protein [Bacteroidota bacterium]HMU13689.1 CotH kinase family protein [Flavobacteriales bacterium]